MTDVWEHPDTLAWIKHVRDDLVPKLEDSAVSVSLVTPGAVANPDVKFAVELGMSILLDKPIILLVMPGAQVPAHLVRVADAIVEGDPADPTTAARLRDEVMRVVNRAGKTS